MLQHEAEMCESTARLVPLEEIPDSLVIFRTHAINVSLQGLTIITRGWYSHGLANDET